MGKGKKDETKELIDQLLGQMDLIRRLQRRHIRELRRQNRLLKKAVEQDRRSPDDWWKRGERPPWDGTEM